MNRLRFHITSIVLLFCFITTNAITPKKVQKIRQIEGILYIIENNRAIRVNNHVITVRLKNSIELPKEIHKIRENKLGFIDIEVPGSIDIEEYVEELKKTEKFETVEYNGIGECLYSPDDTHISYQWHLNKINMPQAWEFETGNPNIKIAIIDTGIDAGHQDLGYGNQNYSHVDTLNSWDYMRNVTYMHPRYYHGTAVAGIIGAKTNNEIGVAGITGGNGCKGTTLLSFCIGESHDINDEVIGDAIIDAVDNGSKIINLSVTTIETTEIDEAIEYAYNNGVIVVCAAGNNSWQGVNFPASSEMTIAVGGTTQSNVRASDSSYGIGLDFVAPGTNIYTTTLGNNYDSFHGTSFAAPQVSGVIALMLAINSNLTFEEIHSILKNTSRKLEQYTYNDNGWNNETGFGLIDAHAALLLTYANTLKLSGKDSIDGMENYMLNGVKFGHDIIWSIDNPNFSISSSDSTCVVSYAQTNYFDTAILTASVMNDSDTIKTLSKRLVHKGVIGGDAVLCDSNTYHVNSCVDDVDITWSIDNPSFIINSNDSVCTVTYNDTLQYDTSTLTAAIIQSNDTLATITKKIVHHGTNLFVEGWQEEEITPNGTSPENHFTIPDDEAVWEGDEPDIALEGEIDEELEPIPIDSIFNPHPIPHEFIDIQGIADIYGGTLVRLTSTRFDGMDITFSGRTAPEQYYRPSEQEIYFLMPYMENPYTIDLCATSPGGCHDFNLRFNVKLLPGDVYGDEDIYVHFTGSQVGITLMCAEDIPLGNGQVQLATWTLGIVNAQTGQWVYNTTVHGQSTSVNTASWNNGVYIIRAGYNNHIYTKKFTVSH